jgi:HAD superfamily hydrolase (TIGR01484 family)
MTDTTRWQNKKVVIFDLDGTLAESKQPLDSEMAELLEKLLTHHMVAVISGGSFEQFSKQFLSSLSLSAEKLHNLILLPTSGAALYRYENNAWKEIYRHVIAPEDAGHIIQVLEEACAQFGFALKTEFGKTIENRGSQITLSPLGQQAPVEAKKDWDPDQMKRIAVVASIATQIPNFKITIGGMTSIDITENGIDKAYGIQEIGKHLALDIEAMLFVGDALYPGGNDEPAKKTGIDCVSVKDVAETKSLIREITAS